MWRLTDPANVWTLPIDHPPHQANGTRIIDTAVPPDGSLIAALFYGEDRLSQPWAYTDAWTTPDRATSWSNAYGVYVAFDPWDRLLFSRDGTMLAANQALGHLGILDPETGTSTDQFGAVVPWMFSADGTTIAGADLVAPDGTFAPAPALVHVSDGTVVHPPGPPIGGTFVGIGVGPSPANAARVVYQVSPAAFVYAENGVQVGSDGTVPAGGVGGTAGTGGGAGAGGGAGTNLVTYDDFTNDGPGHWQIEGSGTLIGNAQLCVSGWAADTVVRWTSSAGNVTLAKGSSYRISYQASGSGVNMHVKVGLAVPPYTADFETVPDDALTGSPQPFAHTFTPAQNDPNVGFAFSFMGGSGAVCLDDITLASF